MSEAVRWTIKVSRETDLSLRTTNHPEVLEPALAGRPGRIDQVIEIGLPEDRYSTSASGHRFGKRNLKDACGTMNDTGARVESAVSTP